MTKNDFVKVSKGEFSKTQQINYTTVLPGFDLVQMADDCDEYILTKNRLSDIRSNVAAYTRTQFPIETIS